MCLALISTPLFYVPTFNPQVEHLVTAQIDEEDEHSSLTIKDWPSLERLWLQGSTKVVSLTLICPNLRVLSIFEMKKLETCRLDVPMLRELNLISCPLLDVSSMMLPSL